MGEKAGGAGRGGDEEAEEGGWEASEGKMKRGNAVQSASGAMETERPAPNRVAKQTEGSVEGQIWTNEVKRWRTYTSRALMAGA